MAKTFRLSETVIVSTRIRLARNFAAYPFPERMDEEQASDIVHLVEVGLADLDENGTFTRYDIAELDEQELLILQEQYLISPALIQSKRGAAFVSADKTLSIMVNEEDHLREQYIFKGFDFYKAFERLSAIDDGLAYAYDFAYDKKLGYLTACPSNLGTGMRASVMMFLPGLIRSGQLKKMLPSLRKEGLTVRGAFGEGSTAEGYLYQISNERTLGISEGEILEQMQEVAEKLCEAELTARVEMMKTAGTETRDRCLRAYGTLKYCAQISWKEFMSLIGDIKLGAILGVFQITSQTQFDEFLDYMRPATFRKYNGLQEESEQLLSEVRAEEVNRMIAELVKLV